MSKTDNIIFRINKKLKEDFMKVIENDCNYDNMTDYFTTSIKRKIERDKKRNQ